MKDLSELVNNFKPTTTANRQMQTDVVIDEFAKNIINKVFDQLSVVFPAWKHAWPTDKELSLAKMEWTKAFNENSINTLEQVKFGFVKARRSESDFLPSCGKFISWCTPTAEDLGYPSEHNALRECNRHKRIKEIASHNTSIKITTRPFIIELYSRIDWWLMSHATSKTELARAEKHFKEEYITLIKSGYQEPVETNHERLETEEATKVRMTPEQKEDEKQRALERIKDMRKAFAKSKADNLINKGE